MTINHNQHNRARLAGVIAAKGAGWSFLADASATVAISIAMTPKRAAGGLSQGGIPFS